MLVLHFYVLFFLSKRVNVQKGTKKQFPVFLTKGALLSHVPLLFGRSAYRTLIGQLMSNISTLLICHNILNENT